MPLRPASAVRTPARSLLHHKQDSTQRQPHAGSVFEVSLGERIEGGGGEGQEEGLTYARWGDKLDDHVVSYGSLPS